MARLKRGTRGRAGGGHQPVTAFGALLVQRRITSEALAAAMGYSEAAVRSWRDGQRVPNKGARVMLLRHLPDLDDAKLVALLTSPPPPDWLTARLVEHALTVWRANTTPRLA